MEKEKTAPKEFKVGDRVKVVAMQPGCESPDSIGRYFGRIYTITEIDRVGWCYLSNGGKYIWAPEWLESCEEPEAEELNLLEILKGCDGMEIYSPMFGSIGYDEIYLNENEERYPVEAFGICFTKEGSYFNNEDALPMLFPSRELYEKYPLDAHAAWQEWQQIKDTTISITCAGAAFEAGLSFGSIADRDACLKEISAIIEKYSKNE